MSKSTKHVYEVVEIYGHFEGVEVGGHLVQAGHVRKHHEPFRQWDFLDPGAETNDGDRYGSPFKTIVGKHIGEYEKVKHLLARGES